jgi:hypothetical protein
MPLMSRIVALALRANSERAAHRNLLLVCCYARLSLELQLCQALRHCCRSNQTWVLTCLLIGVLLLCGVECNMCETLVHDGPGSLFRRRSVRGHWSFEMQTRRRFCAAIWYRTVCRSSDVVCVHEHGT